MKPSSVLPLARPPARLAARGGGGFCSVSGQVLLPLQAAHRRSATRRYTGPVGQLMRLQPRLAREWTLRRLRLLLGHARATCPFWRDRMAATGFDPRDLRCLEDLAALPPLTKADIVGRGLEMRSEAYRGRTLITTSSGGTTGAPLPLVQLPAAVWWKAATAVVLRRNMGWCPGDRVSLLWGAARDFPAEGGGWRGAKDRLIHRWVEHVQWLPANRLSDDLLDDYVERIRRFRPKVLLSYPSVADRLARRMQARGVRLRIPMTLLTAEVVYPAQRARVAETLGTDVFTFYGAREVGWIAEECRAEHRLHINTPGVHVEVESDGRILLTDLVDPMTPLIRYDVGDRGRFADAPCPCGDPRPVIEAVEGRTAETITLPSGETVMWALIDARAYGLEHGIVETQLVQRAPDRFEIRWVAAEGGDTRLDIYADMVRGYLGEEVQVSYTQVDRIEAEPNGKVRSCILLPEA